MTGTPHSLVRAARSGGAGWMMSFIELLVTEYRKTEREAVFIMPLTAAFALFNARYARLGIDRPGFGDTAAGDARERVFRYFDQHYQIV